MFAAIFPPDPAAFFPLPSAWSRAPSSSCWSCFDRGLGTMPALAADYFRSKHMGAIFGLILTASGSGSILGPLLLAFSLEVTGGHGLALRLLGALASGGTLIPLLLRPPARARAIPAPAMT